MTHRARPGAEMALRGGGPLGPAGNPRHTSATPGRATSGPSPAPRAHRPIRPALGRRAGRRRPQPARRRHEPRPEGEHRCRPRRRVGPGGVAVVEELGRRGLRGRGGGAGSQRGSSSLRVPGRSVASGAILAACNLLGVAWLRRPRHGGARGLPGHIDSAMTNLLARGAAIGGSAWGVAAVGVEAEEGRHAGRSPPAAGVGVCRVAGGRRERAHLASGDQAGEPAVDCVDRPGVSRGGDQPARTARSTDSIAAVVAAAARAAVQPGVQPAAAASAGKVASRVNDRGRSRAARSTEKVSGRMMRMIDLIAPAAATVDSGLRRVVVHDRAAIAHLRAVGVRGAGDVPTGDGSLGELESQH